MVKTMGFRKLDQQPRAGAIAEPYEAPLVGAIKVPPFGLLSKENAFWRTMFQEADQAGDALVRRHAEGMTQGLRDSAKALRSARLIIENYDRASALDREQTAEWHSETLIRVGYSRMLREMLPPLADMGLSFTFLAGDVGVGFDLDPTDYARSGVHFKDYLLREGLGIEPPDSQSSEWYEGESVYLHVSAPPAQPTGDFTEKFEEFFDTPFVPEDYCSVVPRLKAEAW